MRNIKIGVLLFIIVSMTLFGGCATVFKGYYDDVQLRMPADSIKIFTNDGAEVPITKTVTLVNLKFYNSKRGEFDSLCENSKYSISLRSNTDHVLLIKKQSSEKKIHVYPQISTGWFVLDLMTLTFWVDMYTGNWNHFQKIDLAQ